MECKWVVATERLGSMAGFNSCTMKLPVGVLVGMSAEWIELKHFFCETTWANSNFGGSVECIRHVVRIA
jgi:hypothetical protein